jgi:exoribonuclease R
MIIKSWLRGPWWDAAGVKHEGPVTEKVLPTDNPRHQGLIGIVDCVIGASVGQGFTSRGVPLYLCYPLRVDYPPFLVAVKTPYTVPPIVVFNYEHWEGKWPRGGISQVLGFTGNPAVEHDAIIRSVQLPRSKMLENVTNDVLGHSTTPWDFVCNIDPKGCQDVDDIICWRSFPNGVIEFAVAIADVAAWIPEGSTYDIDARLRGSTLYDDGVAVDPMFPTSISHGVASLLADGVARPAVAIVYTLLNGVVSLRWEQILTPVHQAYTYESVLESPHGEFIRSCVSTIHGKDIGPDSHLWIEALMVAYNTAVAEVLHDKRVGLLRVHEGTQLQDWTNIATATRCAELAWYGSRGGLYVESAKAVNTRHAGLNKSVYCHASSPLRRYADLVNQRWLKHCIFGSTRPNADTDADGLNARCSTLKSCEGLLWFLGNIDVKSITSVDGFVVEMGVRGVKVYFPSLRRCLWAAVAPVQIAEKVSCRIFCDFKACNLVQRYVVQINSSPK